MDVRRELHERVRADHECEYDGTAESAGGDDDLNSIRVEDATVRADRSRGQGGSLVPLATAAEGSHLGAVPLDEADLPGA